VLTPVRLGGAPELRFQNPAQLAKIDVVAETTENEHAYVLAQDFSRS
jgi:hypothetical protein